MRICQTCGIEHNTNYLNQCAKCYKKNFFKNIKERNCQTCNKLFKSCGKNCYVCAKNIRQQKIIKTPCFSCGRDNVAIYNKTLKLCNTCNRHKKAKENPLWNEERKKKNLITNRRYRGTPLDAPKRERKGTWVNKDGYVVTLKYDHPNASSKGSIKMHTLVMSEYLGRPLKKGESVHHKNGLRDDNRIENLELWVKSQTPGQRVEDKIKWAKEFLESYGYEVYLKKG